MSTLKADTIQSTGGGAATLIKQVAAKHAGIYDAAGTAYSIINQSSKYSDDATGKFVYNYTNNFSSNVLERVFFTFGHHNSADNGSSQSSGSSRGPSNGMIDGEHVIATNATHADHRYGANSASNGANTDVSHNNTSCYGDLA